MINEICKEAESRMVKSVDALKTELTKLRTGRAHTSLLEHIRVPYYGADTPLQQVATIGIEGPRTLTVTPWEKDMVAEIEKAIRNSDLGLNPASAGMIIRVPLPSLTEERRRELTKVVRDEAERARVAVRNIRRDANNHIKDLLKGKEIGEDEQHSAEARIQKLTDERIKEVDAIMTAKEADLMEI